MIEITRRVRTQSHPTIFLFSLVLATLFLLTACSAPHTDPDTLDLQPRPTASPKAPTLRGTGDTLEILFWQAPTILNPHLSTSAKDWDASRITYEPLASFDAEGNLIPYLAAEIPSLGNGGVSADGRSVTWKLREDVRWSDGEPFTAEDVAFTYDFVVNPDTGATTTADFDGIEDVIAVDDHTVRIEFSEVNPAWNLPFVGERGMILPRHIFENYNNSSALDAPANLMPVGTGPYRVESFKPQEVLFLGNELIETNKIVFEPNPYFREEDKPYFSRLELRGGGIVSEAARSVLQVGDVDFATNLQLEEETLNKLEAANKGRILLLFGGRVERILLNRTDPNQRTADGERSSIQFPHPILSDLKVRQALSYAIDREAIAELYGKAGQPSSNILVSPSRYNSPNTSYEFNLEKAAALLDEAGWKDGDGDGVREKGGVPLHLTFQTSINSIRQDTQRLIQLWLSSIGVEVELEIVDSSVFFSSDPDNPKTRFHFYSDLEEFRTGNRNPDPIAYMKSWTCDEIAQESNNWSGANIERWCDPAYDALYEQLTKELDPEIRKQLFIQMNDMLIEDIVVIPLADRATLHGVGNDMEGVVLTPWDSATWNIKDWRRIKQ